MDKQIFPGWLPVQVASHYGFPLAELDGTDQSIAIISLGGVLDLDELAKDFKAIRIPLDVSNVRLIDVNGENISDKQNNGTTIETHIDVEVIGSICPEAKISIYRAPNDGGAGMTAAVKAAVDDDNDVISISWGRNEKPSDPDSELEKVLGEAKIKGITVCVAAGDGGSSNQRDGWHAVPAPDNLAHVGYPASSPHVLSFGGTEIVLSGGVHHEVVWNNSDAMKAATGGGVSEVFDVPKSQSDHHAGIVSANTGKSGRIVPDMAFMAAAGDWQLVETSKLQEGGGTSAVAPLFASLVVLANQKRMSLGKERLGFLNEKIYKMARNGDYFYNVTTGHNRPTKNYPGYDATEGYDACTGLGIPKAGLLLDGLVELE